MIVLLVDYLSYASNVAKTGKIVLNALGFLRKFPGNVVEDSLNYNHFSRNFSLATIDHSVGQRNE
jgi:hypothetical protein